MESQLQELIEKIKNDGILEAEKKAGSIVAGAGETSQRIIKEARSQAEQIVSQAKIESRREKEAGEKALEQAGRNLVLSLRKNIESLLKELVVEDAAAAMTPESLARILEKMIGGWKPDQAEMNFEALVSEEDARALEKGFISRLRERVKAGVVLKPVDSVDAGFRIGVKDRNMVFDFTDQAIAEVLAQYLNPRLAKLLLGK